MECPGAESREGLWARCYPSSHIPPLRLLLPSPAQLACLFSWSMQCPSNQAYPFLPYLYRLSSNQTAHNRNNTVHGLAGNPPPGIKQGKRWLGPLDCQLWSPVTLNTTQLANQIGDKLQGQVYNVEDRFRTITPNWLKTVHITYIAVSNTIIFKCKVCMALMLTLHPRTYCIYNQVFMCIHIVKIFMFGFQPLYMLPCDTAACILLMF